MKLRYRLGRIVCALRRHHTPATILREVLEDDGRWSPVSADVRCTVCDAPLQSSGLSQ